jgi:hypothetical protein
MKALLCCMLLARVAIAQCTDCHQALAASHQSSRHALSLRPMPGSAFAERLLRASLSERNGTSFVYRKEADQFLVQAQTPAESAQATLLWLFGAGKQAQTAVGQLADGRWIEHRLSLYPPANRIARTFGHPPSSTPDARAALGLINDQATIGRCFHCHAANVQTRPALDLSAIQPGITCQRCHGEGRQHIANPTLPMPKLQGNSQKAQVAFCAQCHRSPSAATLPPELTDPLTVRFAPLGLLASRCFQLSQRMSCQTCHDSHANAEPRSNVAYYAERCRSCHAEASASRGCPRSQPSADCLACHMPSVNPAPLLHFTDHRIRKR